MAKEAPALSPKFEVLTPQEMHLLVIMIEDELLPKRPADSRLTPKLAEIHRKLRTRLQATGYF
jgi:hypothetical protein